MSAPSTSLPSTQQTQKWAMTLKEGDPTTIKGVNREGNQGKSSTWALPTYLYDKKEWVCLIHPQAFNSAAISDGGLIFIQLSDLIARLTASGIENAKRLAEGDQSLVTLTPGGGEVKLPDVKIDGTITRSMKAIGADALNYFRWWREMADEAERYANSSGHVMWSPQARFWKPFHTAGAAPPPPKPNQDIKFYFVPCKSSVVGGKTIIVQDLKDAIEAIYNVAGGDDGVGVRQRDVEVLQEPPSDTPLYSMGFLRLWALYVKNPELLWQNAYPPWVFPFPSEEQILTFNDYILNQHGKGKQGMWDEGRRQLEPSYLQYNDPSVQSTVNISKVMSAAGQKRKPDQQAVMNKVSATAAGEGNFFPGFPDDYDMKSKSGAEWLHRSAFSFGGLGTKGDIQSSQAPNNLIYGLLEANTSMMKDENAIKSTLGVDAKLKKEKADCYVILKTTLMNGEANRAEVKKYGDESTISDPGTKFRNAQLTWITPRLSYQVQIYRNHKLFAASETIFDPFLRLFPTLLEILVDEYIIDNLLLTDHFTPSSSSSSSSSAQQGLFVLIVSNPSVTKSVDHSFPLFNALALTSNPHIESVVHTSIPTASIHRPVGALLSTPAAIQTDLSAQSHTITPDVLSAWAGATRNLPITLHGLMVNNPQALDRLLTQVSPVSILYPDVSALPSTSTPGPEAKASFVFPSASVPPPPDGFILTGDIALFGLTSLQAKLYSWHGPPPTWVHLTSVTPIYRMATLSQDLKLSTAIPSLNSTPYDKFGFKNATFTYQNYNFDKERVPGLHIDADLVIDSSFGVVHDILTNVFGIPNPTLHLHAALGDQNFDKGLVVGSFALEGFFAGIKMKPFDGLEFTEIGLRLLGIPSSSYPDWTEHMVYDFNIFGTMIISAPSGPLVLSYVMGGGDGVAHLSADVEGNVWSDSFGVKGLTLSAVSLNASVSTKEPLKSLQFDVEAAFDGESVTAYFIGSYAPGGEFYLSARVANFGCAGVLDVFKHLTGGSLELPSISVYIGSATLVLASGAGLTITLSDLTVSSFSAVDATLHVSDAGIMVQGNLAENSSISLGEVDLTKAYIRVSFAKSTDGKTTDVIFGGEVQFQGITIDAFVHLYPSDDKERIEWTIFGALSSTGDITLSKFVQELKGSFLDGVVLRNASFIVASKEDPTLEAVLPKPYPIHQGVQICAELGELQALNALTRSSTPNLLLSAGWSSTTGFTLDVLLPSPSTLHLGNGITTDPFTLQIQTKPPALRLMAGLKVPVPRQSEPLDFTMSLDMNLVEGKATGQMHGYWTNPFGISDSVRIGPDLALSVEIIFAQFVTTGTPSGLGFVGGLQIGKVPGQVALNVSEDPMREVLYGEVKELDVNDLVSLARDVTKLDIPQPPNWLNFKDVKLYVCPAGTTIGTIVYPQGFSFAATMVIFGASADVAVAIDDTDVKIAGGVDNFSLGPLVVQGQHGPRATVDIQMGTRTQKGHIDGLIELFDATASLLLDFDVLPSPKFQFDTILHFTDLLTFDVHASLLGSVTDLHNLSDLNFIFLATLEQHIVSYVNEQLQAQFDIAKHAVEQGIDSAKDKVSAAQNDADVQLATAQAALDAAFKTWQENSEAVHKSSQQAIDAYNSEMQQLQSAVDSAKASFDTAVQNAERALTNAQIDSDKKMAAAQASLEATQNDWANQIQSAQQAVDSAADKMNADVRDAKNQIASAQGKVDSIQTEIDKCQDEIDRAKSNPIPIPKFPDIPKLPDIPKFPDIPSTSWTPWFLAQMPTQTTASFAVSDGGALSLPVLYVQLGSLQAALATATAALTSANAALTGGAVAADQVALGAARQTLTGVKKSADTGLFIAKSAVDFADEETASAIYYAQRGVAQVQQGYDAYLLAIAQQALESFKVAGAATLEAAQQAVDTLVQSSEWFAYQSALAGLAAAKSATPALQAASAALATAEDSAGAVLDAAEWASSHGASLFNVQEIGLEGTMKAIVNGGDAFKAEVKGQVAATSFDVQLTFDPRKTGEFLIELFDQLWAEIQSGLVSL